MAVPTKPTKSRKRIPLTPEVCELVRRLLRRGIFQHDIAAILGVNQGRVSEISTGKRGTADLQMMLFD